MSILKGNLFPNIFTITAGLIIFVTSLEFFMRKMYLKGWILFGLFALMILLFFKINWNYFDTHSSYGKINLDKN
ncbi:hypothetical protein ISS08_01040 [Candidatus Pacearchaeota archaeon]|nr:hypothetical protein [Candidatus Pacearchaeota archaeon]